MISTIGHAVTVLDLGERVAAVFKMPKERGSNQSLFGFVHCGSDQPVAFGPRAAVTIATLSFTQVGSAADQSGEFMRSNVSCSSASLRPSPGSPAGMASVASR